MRLGSIDIAMNDIKDFCRRWKVQEFALFGSALGEDFGPQSDVDVLVTFSPEATPSLFDLGAMQQELEDLFGRHVDLVEKAGLRNPFRRQSILASMKVIYES
jgi:predicted nucleotidyltransferase